MQYQLSKSNWNTLEKMGLTDGGQANGFTNTTQFFDENIVCSSSYATHIKIGSTIFRVQYVSGCFYPIWSKEYVTEPDYEVTNKGITRLN